MIGQEYELLKMVSWGGDHKSETYKENRPDQKNQVDQNDQVDSGKTREKIAEEHDISLAKVQRSVELSEAIKTIGEAAPEVARGEWPSSWRMALAAIVFSE